MSTLIYLDHAATTPLRPEALAAMEPFLTENYANPSSVYRLAQAARSALDSARDTVAGVLGAQPADLIFTSGGSEANNAAIKGIALAGKDHGRGQHVVTTAIEHHAVLHPMQELAQVFGFDLTIVPVESNGLVDPDQVERALRPDTVLISAMWANNEIGTIQPIQEIGNVARARGIPFHVDAVQAIGNVPVDLEHLPIDALSLSAHKFYGPKGVGVLYLRRGVPWWPLLTGGGQERNRRAGTENVAGIVGMAKALELAEAEREENVRRIRSRRDYLMTEIPARIADSTLNGDAEHRLPGNANFCFAGVPGEALLVGLDMAGIMASGGSACASGSLETSHVLSAIGVPDWLARSSLRLTAGRETTMDEVECTVDTLERLVSHIRQLTPQARGA